MPMLRPFYDENFTEFSRKSTGVPFLFDLLVGNDYQNCAEMSMIDKDTVELKGTNLSIRKIIDKLDRAGVDYVCNKDKNDIQPILIKNPMERFIKASIGTSLEMDSTSNKVQLKFNPDQYKWHWDKNK